MLDVILDALKDSAITFVFILILYFILSFFEDVLANKISNRKKFTPLLGSALGLIPQCGLSIVSADLYQKRKITMGTILAIFIACSDEAIPILLSSCKTLSDVVYILLLLICKFVFAGVTGMIVDSLLKEKAVHVAREVNDQGKTMIHQGCCHHHIEKDEEDKNDFLHKHFLHPLIHSLKIMIYVLIINLLFGLILYWIGEDVITKFLNQNIYLTPFLAALVGLIPNCASSVILSKMFLLKSLSFGATLAGLICNAGLGLVFLFKDRKHMKNNFLILGILFMTALLFGYLCLLIELLIR